MSTLPPEIQRLVDILQHDKPQLALLFGSCARGDRHEQSDIDLLIVKETDRPFLERIGEVLAKCPKSPRLDALVYTPAEFVNTP